LVEDHLQSPPEDVRRFGQAVSEAYRQVDRVVGELVAGFGEGNVVVISDHGFTLESKKNKRQRYNHQSGPSGIFLASGPAFSRGEVGELTLFHVMPILLATKGFPVPSDIVEEVPTQVFAPGFLGQHPVTPIDSYGTISPSGVDSESAVDQEMMERLEALGYLD
jgi:predicted AlkP superfamily phosphohydrolase/phosphomutase